ncbi:hypothetical protein [Clostridium sp. AN503]|uniref:hypothetical protein n=1 Tax=Clostridium sp. AN503 TaxID=3160598 RepID=UPI0034596617
MKKLYDLISTFCILITASVIAYFSFYTDSHTAVISYDILLKYAVIIVLAMLIFEGVALLPIQSAVLAYMLTASLITLETVLLECIVWNWLPLTVVNTLLLAAWIFIVSGIITLLFLKKNREDARLINQQIEKWKRRASAENS